MLNSFDVQGYIQKGPVMKKVGSKSTSLLTFDIANQTGFGENKRTNYFKCQLWGKQAESLERFVTEGTQVVLSGEMRMEQWEASDGSKRRGFSLNIGNDGFNFAGSGKSDGNGAGKQSTPAPVQSDFEDDIPF